MSLEKKNQFTQSNCVPFHLLCPTTHQMIKKKKKIKKVEGMRKFKIKLIKTNFTAGLKKKKKKHVWEGRDFIGTNTLKKGTV